MHYTEPSASPMTETLLDILSQPEICPVRQTFEEGWEMRVDGEWIPVTFLPTHWTLTDMLEAGVIVLGEQRVARLRDRAR